MVHAWPLQQVIPSPVGGHLGRVTGGSVCRRPGWEGEEAPSTAPQPAWQPSPFPAAPEAAGAEAPHRVCRCSPAFLNRARQGCLREPFRVC